MSKSHDPTEVFEYKVVEISKVTDERIERELNELAPDGWLFHDVKFVNLEGVRRPVMAFLFFRRPRPGSSGLPHGAANDD